MLSISRSAPDSPHSSAFPVPNLSYSNIHEKKRHLVRHLCFLYRNFLLTSLSCSQSRLQEAWQDFGIVFHSVGGYLRSKHDSSICGSLDLCKSDKKWLAASSKEAFCKFIGLPDIRKDIRSLNGSFQVPLASR